MSSDHPQTDGQSCAACYRDGMVSWYVRIRVVRDESTFGWTTIGPVTTEVLPRVGEVVALDSDLVSEQLLRLVALGAPDAPTVTKIEHFLGHTGATEVVVTVRARTAQYMNDTLAAEFPTIPERWLPNSGWPA